MRAEEETLAGATRNLQEIQPVVTLLAGATKLSPLLSGETRTTTMKTAGPAEAEAEAVVADSRTKVVIVLSQRAASSVAKRVIFQEIALTLAVAEVVEAVLEVHASSATKRVTWPVNVPMLIQQVAMILRVVAVAEVELQAVVAALSARVKAISRENVPMTMVKAMISHTRDRGVTMMAALSVEEAVAISPQVSHGEITPHLFMTLVHSGVLLQATLTIKLVLQVGTILTLTTTRLLMMLGATTTTLVVVAAVAGTDNDSKFVPASVSADIKLNLFISM